MYADAPDSLLIGRVGLHGLRLGDIYLWGTTRKPIERIRTRAQYRDAEWRAPIFPSRWPGARPDPSLRRPTGRPASNCIAIYVGGPSSPLLLHLTIRLARPAIPRRWPSRHTVWLPPTRSTLPPHSPYTSPHATRHLAASHKMNEAVVDAPTSSFLPDLARACAKDLPWPAPLRSPSSPLRSFLLPRPDRRSTTAASLVYPLWATTVCPILSMLLSSLPLIRAFASVERVPLRHRRGSDTLHCTASQEARPSGRRVWARKHR
jgi:hypothetical protein